MLVVGGRPAEPDVREHGRAHIDVAVHTSVAASWQRRSSGVDAQLRPLFVVPSACAADQVPPRSPIVLDAQRPPVPHATRFVATRSSRGPPQS